MATSEDLLPFDRAAQGARETIGDFGRVGKQLEALYDDARAALAEVTAEMEQRGQPTPTTPPRKTLEWNLLGLWAQALTAYVNEYLRVTLIAGDQIARTPRLSIHRPDRGAVTVLE